MLSCKFDAKNSKSTAHKRNALCRYTFLSIPNEDTHFDKPTFLKSFHVSKRENYIRDYVMCLTGFVTMENQFLNQLQHYVAIALREEKVVKKLSAALQKKTVYKKWQAF